MRIVELYYDEEQLMDVPDLEIQRAIGRMSLWSLNRYEKVRIFHDRGKDLIAHYIDLNDSDNRYTIGAVWRPESKEYTFHS